MNKSVFKIWAYQKLVFMVILLIWLVGESIINPSMYWPSGNRDDDIILSVLLSLFITGIEAFISLPLIWAYELMITILENKQISRSKFTIIGVLTITTLSTIWDCVILTGLIFLIKVELYPIGFSGISIIYSIQLIATSISFYIYAKNHYKTITFKQS